MVEPAAQESRATCLLALQHQVALQRQGRPVATRGICRDNCPCHGSNTSSASKATPGGCCINQVLLLHAY